MTVSGFEPLTGGGLVKGTSLSFFLIFSIASFPPPTQPPLVPSVLTLVGEAPTVRALVCTLS